MKIDINEAAKSIYDAEKNKKTIAPFTSRSTDINTKDAYNIQLQYVERRKEDGAVVKGKKIGLTSEAMQHMLGVDQPDYGHILDDMIFPEDTPINAERFIAPRIEFEVAFVLKENLKGPGVSKEDVIRAIDYALPAAEIIDSRIEDWKIKFEDTVADNGSSAGVVFGKEKRELSDLDLPNLEMVIHQNGKFLDKAKGSAVMGDPLNAVVWLVNSLGVYDITLRAGEGILAGALTRAINVQNGTKYKAVFSELGSIELEFNK